MQPSSLYAVSATNGSASVTVSDNDPSETAVALEAPASVAETAGTLTVAVRATTVRDEAPHGQVTVLLTSADGTATAGENGDYAAVDASVRFAPGDFERTRVDGEEPHVHVATTTETVTVRDDAEAERDETFTLRLRRPAGVRQNIRLPDGPSEVSITDNEAAGRPTDVTAAPGDGALTVSWSEVASAAGYKVQWKSGAEAFETAAADDRQRIVSGGTTTSVVVTGLTNGTTYAVRVIGFNSGGDGTPSPEATGTPRTPAAGVTGVMLSEGDGRITVSWSPAVRATSYTLQWKSGAGESFETAAADGREHTLPGAAVTRYVITGLDNCTSYTVRVFAANRGVAGPPSAEAAATPTFEPEGARPGTALVSNTGRSIDGTLSIGVYAGGVHAQAFTTGSDTGMFSLESVGVRIGGGASLDPALPSTAWIYRVNADGGLGAAVHELTTPARLACNRVNLYKAPAGAALMAETRYLLVFAVVFGGTTDILAAVTSSDAEDGGKAAGWSIDDAARLDGSPRADGKALMIAINGRSRSLASVPTVRAATEAATADHTIELAWTPVYFVGPNAVDGYGIQVSENGETWTTLVADTGDTDLEYSHGGLPRGVLRHYRVQALAGTAGSGYGRSDSTFTTPNPPGVPQVTVRQAPLGPSDSLATVLNPHTLEVLAKYELSWPEVDDGSEAAINVRYEVVNTGDGTARTGRQWANSDGSVHYAEVYASDISEIRVCALNYATDRVRPDTWPCSGGPVVPGTGNGGPGRAAARAAPFAARFENVPESHDGLAAFAFDLRFSQEAGISCRLVMNGMLEVSGAAVTRVRRGTVGSDLDWTITVTPSGFGDVTIRLPARACGEKYAVCAQGRRLSEAVNATVAGPATFAVADAEVEEADGAVLAFAVSLSRKRDGATTVDYATSDGTATAGSDYAAASGTLTLASGETSKTVSVMVLDDILDEGNETLTLTLSDPSPGTVKLADATATGTITNDDPMPGAWVARFGRTVGSQVMEAVTRRLDGGPSPHLTVGGVGLGAPLAPQDWLAGQLVQETEERRPEERTLTGRDLLLGTSFHLVSDAEASGGPALSAWGRVAVGGFQAEADGVTLDGSVTTGLLGFDVEWERLLAGLLLSHSEGDGAYGQDGGSDRGTLDGALTGLYPFARLRLGVRLSVWGLAGAGSGGLTLARHDAAPVDTGLNLRLGAVGVTGTLSRGGTLDLSVKSDALWARTDSSAATGQLAAASAQASRLRLILEAGRTLAPSAASTLTPTLQLGLRHDGGDAETGTGVEVGAGVRYLAGLLTVEAQVRALLAHEAAGYDEWGGGSGAVRLSPGPSALGASLAVMPSWGEAGDGMARLRSRPDAPRRRRAARRRPPASALVRDGAAAPAAGRLDAELGYGLPALRGRGVLTPYARLALGEGDGHSWHLGARLDLDSSLGLGMEGSRRDRPGSGTVHDLALRATVPW